MPDGHHVEEVRVDASGRYKPRSSDVIDRVPVCAEPDTVTVN
jgi:hypothetical protein